MSKSAPKPSVLYIFNIFLLRNVLRVIMACVFFSICELPQVVRAWCGLRILTCKCASRHNSAHFFDMSTSKSIPGTVCFVQFDLERCFRPQRRALFGHLNFQKCLKCDVFWLFHLAPQRHATFHLSSSQKAPHLPL